MSDTRLLGTLTLLLAVAEQALVQLEAAGVQAEQTRSAVADLTEELQYALPRLSRVAAA
jgi:hypothetical protein